MPNRRDHDLAGGLSGAAYAVWRAHQDPAGSPVLEGFGGLGGGVFASRWPDFLEPACWNHRRTAHSATIGALIVVFANRIEEAAAWCRAEAAAHEVRAQDPTLSASEQAMRAAVAVLLRLLAGFLNGLVAGYVSHLAMDGCTPAGIPVL